MRYFSAMRCALRAAWVALLVPVLAVMLWVGMSVSMAASAHASGAHASAASSVEFTRWLEETKVQARAEGIPQAVIDRALRDIAPIEEVVALDRKQPEKTRSFTQYLALTLPQSRVNTARRLAAEHATALARAEARYGVPRAVIVALWGKESDFGRQMGDFSVVESLATLAFEGRRRELFQSELLHALHILAEEHISFEEMLGSWAGAMGQCQFMPSSFRQFAVDADGDGKRDIWSSEADIFASIANYLSSSGWNKELPVALEVELPENFTTEEADIKTTRPVSAWQARGVRLSGGGALPAPNAAAGDWQASVIYPGKPGEGAYLVSDNFKVLLKWNRSRYFATAISILADRIDE